MLLSTMQNCVEISLGLIGVMTLWLGLMKIAEDSGIVESLQNY